MGISSQDEGLGFSRRQWSSGFHDQWKQDTSSKAKRKERNDMINDMRKMVETGLRRGVVVGAFAPFATSNPSQGERIFTTFQPAPNPNGIWLYQAVQLEWSKRRAYHISLLWLNYCILPTLCLNSVNDINVIFVGQLIQCYRASMYWSCVRKT